MKDYYYDVVCKCDWIPGLRVSSARNDGHRCYRTWMERAYRPSRVCQIRGSIDEVTGAYTISYVRIAEEKVRSRWCATDGRTQILEVVEDFRRAITPQIARYRPPPPSSFLARPTVLYIKFRNRVRAASSPPSPSSGSARNSLAAPLTPLPSPWAIL